jgi:hypothetical protein
LELSRLEAILFSILDRTEGSRQATRALELIGVTSRNDSFQSTLSEAHAIAPSLKAQ